MSGLKLTLPLTFSGSGLQPLPSSGDPILSSGSLVLLDPTNITGAWSSPVPTNLQSIPNLAAESAKSMVGSTLDADVMATAYVPGSFSGSAGLLERTTKGGLHGISPQGGTALAGSGPVIALPNRIIKYMLDNKLHNYYVSLWGRPTRIPQVGFAAFAAIGGNGQQTNAGLFYMQPATIGTPWGTRPATTPPLSESRIPTTSLAPSFVSVATSGWYFSNPVTNPAPLPGDGTNTAVTGLYAGGGIYFGSSIATNGIGTTGATTTSGVFNAVGSPSNKDKAGSHIFYRLYIEDLTVSGRTYATVDGIENALFQQQVMTAGGRYYGDTFTDPATIA